MRIESKRGISGHARNTAGVLMLIMTLIAAGCAPVTPGGTKPSPPVAPAPATGGPTPVAALAPTPRSSLVRSFVWQTDGAYGYQMLRPAGWKEVDNTNVTAARGFVVPGASDSADAIGLLITNLEARKDTLQWDVMLQGLLPLFEKGRTLDNWSANVEQQIRQAGSAVEQVRVLPDARIYLLRLDSSGYVPQIMLRSLKVDASSPLVIELLAYGRYASLERLQTEGVVDDLVTMVESAGAIPLDPQNVVPALHAQPTPTAVNVAMTPIATHAPQPAATSPRATDPVLPGGCTATSMGTSLLASPEDGYCLLYPANFPPHFSYASDRLAGTWGVSLFDPHDANRTVSLVIQTSLANGRTLDQVVADELSNFPAEVTAQVTQTPAQLGGESAIILDGLPGVLMNRQLFVIHADRLHHLVLLPWHDKAFSDHQTEAQTLWDTVAESWTFIPGISATPAPSPVTAQCDLVCRDATAAVVLTLTPVPFSTYSPSFRATEDAYNQGIQATQTSQAQLTPTPDHPASAPAPTLAARLTATPLRSGPTSAPTGEAPVGAEEAAAASEPVRQQLLADSRVSSVAHDHSQNVHIPGQPVAAP